MREEKGIHVATLEAGQFKNETSKAICVNHPKLGAHDVWIPASSLHDDSEVFGKKNPDGKLIVKAWFALRMGWG